MKSGLEGRNNEDGVIRLVEGEEVSMKSGLEGRNNPHATPTICGARTRVSMKSGLEGRNNQRGIYDPDNPYAESQ